MSLKTLTVVALAAGTLGLCSAAYADSSTGFYVGGQAGYGNPDYDVSNSNVPNVSFSKDEGGLAGRAYVGYQFNQYFGVETGYTLFSDNTYKFSGPGGSANLKFETQQWDILAKAGMPFGCSGFRGDIKAGAAYVMSKLNATDFSGSDSDNSWNPAAGASLTYNFNKNFAVDVSYLHTFGSSSSIRNHFKNDNFSPNTNLTTLGVSYLFA